LLCLQLGQLRTSLDKPGICFGERGFLTIECSPALIEVLPGDKTLLEKLLTSFEIGIIPVKVCFRMVHGGLQSVDIIVTRGIPGFAGSGISLGGVEGRNLRRDIGRRLGLVDSGEELAFRHMVAFLHQDVRQLTGELGAYVDVIAGLDLA
jgi:hypothetical protein